MNYTAPEYYKEFHCLAGECPDTCCAGWEIGIDAASMKRYDRIPGLLGNRIRNSIHRERSVFCQHQGRCDFLNEDNLCDLYLEGGSELLCRTCRLYPRHMEEFEGVKEITLCLSCIEAARIILSWDRPIKFLTAERAEKQKEDENFDFLLYTQLEDARDIIFEHLRNRAYLLSVRMMMALSLAHDIQRRMIKNRSYEMDGLLKRYRGKQAIDQFARQMEKWRGSVRERFVLMKDMMHLFDEMEVLEPSWPFWLEGLRVVLYNDQEAYEKTWRNIQAGAYGGEMRRWQIWSEQIFTYFVFTYFCGAVYDEHVYGRMKLAVASTLFIQEFALGLWMKNGRIELMELADAAHRYSREMEHSDENRDALMRCLESNAHYRIERMARAMLTENPV